MPKPFTHVILAFPSRDTDLLYRASDGMSLACRSGITVISGINPDPAKKEHRGFLDEKFALMYLKRLADLDANGIALDADDRTPREQLGRVAEIEERYGESKIIAPPPGSGQVLSFKN